MKYKKKIALALTAVMMTCNLASVSAKVDVEAVKTDIINGLNEMNVYGEAALRDLLEQPYLEEDRQEIEEVLGLPLTDTSIETTQSHVIINENKIFELYEEMLGVQCEFHDEYATFFENGELRQSFLDMAKNTYKIPTFRWGGTSSTWANMWHQTGPYESRLGSQETLIPKEWGVEETKTSSPMKMGIPEYLKVAYAINPDAKMIPCVSHYTTTPEEAGKLAHYLLDEADESEYGAKRAADGVEKPTEVYYWEISQEISAWGEENRHRVDFYIQQTRAIAEEIRKVDPDAKIAIAASSAPWGEAHYSDAVKDTDQWWAWWPEQILYGLADIADAIAFHPYYNGNSPHQMMYFMDTMKDIADRIVQELDIKDENGNYRDIKILSTETSRWYPPEGWYMGANTFLSALHNANFVNHSLMRDHVVGSSYHNWMGYKQWAYWSVKDGEFYESPTAKIWKFYGDFLGDRRVDCTYTADDGQWKYNINSEGAWIGDFSSHGDPLFSVVTTARGEDELDVILLNKNAFRSVDVTFDFQNEYTLIEEAELTAPNIGTWAYNATTADFVKTEVKEQNVENFNQYTIKPARVVALRLKTKSKIPTAIGEHTPGESEKEEIVIDTDKTFSDIKNHWARKEISVMLSKNVVSGVGDNCFAPDRDVTRAELAAIAVKALGLDTNVSGSGYSDVAPDAWYAPYANAMKMLGAMRGESFNAGGSISLADACEVVNAIYKSKKGGDNK